jgi:DNA-binding CsgD family transcriptional regulator
MKPFQTNREINDCNRQQVFTLERRIHKGEFSIESVGDHLPGNVLVTDLSQLATVYMNNNGCNILRQSVDELKEQGPEYFQRFFVSAETDNIVTTYLTMQEKQDPAHIYTFAHRVKALNQTSYKWYFASAKLLFEPGQKVSDKVILVVNDVNSAGYIATKINEMLEESDWMKMHFKQFCLLTTREKEIITLLVRGFTSLQVSDILKITKLTVNTHRRNIDEKLRIKSFAELYRYAVVYGLIA